MDVNSIVIDWDRAVPFATINLQLIETQVDFRKRSIELDLSASFPTTVTQSVRHCAVECQSETVMASDSASVHTNIKLNLSLCDRINLLLDIASPANARNRNCKSTLCEIWARTRTTTISQRGKVNKAGKFGRRLSICWICWILPAVGIKDWAIRVNFSV
jgi:hypothetical protein